MKKSCVALVLLICIIALCGCSNDFVMTYHGTPLDSLTYESVDYNGGATTTYVFDFQNNVAKRRFFSPENETSAPDDWVVLKQFSEVEEKQLIDKLYTRGLFSIGKNYKTLLPIIDGGGWTLQIHYSNGKTKVSKGSNAQPTQVFANCAKAFFDLLEEGVLWSVPTEYYCPPNISYSFRVGYSSNSYVPFGARTNYQWNGFGSTGNDAYTANLNYDQPHQFVDGVDYTLVLFTSNYGTFNSYKRFSKCTVTCANFDPQLTNQNVVHSSGWFSQIYIDLQPNKIYVVRLDFSNGDFVEYTFNTKTTK